MMPASKRPKKSAWSRLLRSTRSRWCAKATVSFPTALLSLERCHLVLVHLFKLRKSRDFDDFGEFPLAYALLRSFVLLLEQNKSCDPFVERIWRWERRCQLSPDE